MSSKEKPTILLAQLGVQYASAHASSPHLSVPLALGYLASGLEAAGSLECRRLEMLGVRESLYASDSAIVGAIISKAPRIVGFSCYCWNVNRSLFVAKQIKRLLPGTAVVLGGPEASERALSLMENEEYITAIVRGEGEESFPELVEYLLEGNGSMPPAGCLVREGRELRDGGTRAAVSDPGRFPSPYLSGHLDPSAYGSLNIETVRGCLFRCEYCYYPKGVSELRPFPVERIRAEVRFAHRAGVRKGYLMDPVFNLPDRVAEVCEAIAGENADRAIAFQTEVRAELIDETSVELLHAANVQSVEIGLQSTNSAALANIGRDFSRDRFSRAVRLLLRRGIEVHIGVIIGLPGDGFTEIEETLDYALGLGDVRVHCFLLQILPGTGLWQKAKRLGLERQLEPPYFVRRTPELDSDELILAHAHAVRRVRAAGGANLPFPDFMLCKAFGDAR